MSSDLTKTPSQNDIVPLFKSELTVVEVGVNGNANQGRAFFCFEPNIIEIKGPPQKVSIGLSKHTPSHFKICDFFSTDSFDQIVNVHIAKDGRSVTFHHENKHKCITNLLIEVYDSKEKATIYCDPQAINRPPN
ncbi:MAG: hypothetical protein ACJATK_002276 [Paracoccaceae bacterium]|jgi:hypothetical protein